MELRKYEVPADKLSWRCDPALFKFTTTGELQSLGEFIGQERAIRSIEFGLNLEMDGYNIYVAGLSGTGKTTVVKSYIEKIIREKEVKGEVFRADDWCYLYNFKEPDRAQIVSLPRGTARQFKAQISELLTKTKEELKRAFSSEDYKTQRKRMMEEGQGDQQKLFEGLQKKARLQNFYLQMTQAGPALVPLLEDRPMEEKEYVALSEKDRKALEAKRRALQKRLQSSFEKAVGIREKTVKKVENADKEIGDFTISHLFAPLFARYPEDTKVGQFLQGLKNYTLENLALFKEGEEAVNHETGVLFSQSVLSGRNPFLPFLVNVYIDNTEVSGPPVIVEPNPNFGNLFGKIERRFLLGGYLSDHTMIKPGALALANGGYLLLGALDVLSNMGVWPALKRSIRNKEIRVEDPFEQYGMVVPQGMRPEPMPIKTKVILIGDAYLYQMLSVMDEEYWEIFKVKADFNSQIDITEKNIMDYAAFISGICDKCKVRHFDPAGVARTIEFAARIVSDQEKLSTRFAQIKELVEEANYWAAKEGAELITGKHVQRAIEERRFRHNLVDERVQEMIDRGQIMIDVGGEVVGQVNGLGVYSMGDIAFAKPNRITARTFLGRGGVINIEREAKLSGSTHDKGVLILSGYLGWKYAQERPLSLSASICFEQSYEGVDGDSASSAELYAILSSISGVPIRQNIAVTGSVNQKGEVQPIGGVNLKIEGFYKSCQDKGLTGDQGVMIPRQNVINLMLEDEVSEAVKDGRFHIYAVKTIDEGIEILTGMPLGEKGPDGKYPEETVNLLVDKKLTEMAEAIKRAGGGEKEDKKD
ncbi:MAG: AAA family ATPase [Dehalococcoidia bacterium]|nr:AAA family ATPase [Dehalococcoidia bacterium]